MTAAPAKRTIRPQKASMPKPGPGSMESAAPLQTANGITMEIMKVTPALAAEWLERNISNRSIRANRVNEFARDMLAQNWHDLGDPVRFDADGNMIDGQHRMNAMVVAGEQDPDLVIEFTVVRGILAEHRFAIDTGSRRTAADQLKIDGYSNPGVLAATTGWSMLYERGLIGAERSLATVTHGEIRDYILKNPDVEECVHRVMSTKLRDGIDMPNSKIATGLYLCRKISIKEAEEFYERLGTGTHLMAGDPILALRSRLVDIIRHAPRMTNEDWMSLLFRAWNTRREGKTMKTIPLLKNGESIAVPKLK